jgi:GNAT superfamily N-acetyltransferase
VTLVIRPAERFDVPVIFALIRELAIYEQALEQVTGDELLLADALFGPNRSAEALVAELDDQPVGLALFYRSFSTWECRPGIWLEDLYVPPEHRRIGIGRALVRHLAALAIDRGYARLEWAALDWNTPALDFYERLGARRLDQWRMHRLDGTALRQVADPVDQR